MKQNTRQDDNMAYANEQPATPRPFNYREYFAEVIVQARYQQFAANINSGWPQQPSTPLPMFRLGDIMPATRLNNELSSGRSTTGR